VLVRQAGETGQLYGSVTARDLTEAMEAGGFTVNRSQVALNQPIKTIGMHDVLIALHAEVEAHITVNVARSEDEAERQARGEDVRMAGVAEAEEAAESGEAAETEGSETAESDETAES
jgi:large subunit ribosomal protein L9